MTTYSTTLSGGQATVKVDTTDMAVGNYDVETTYSQNSKFNSSTNNSNLSLNAFTIVTDSCSTDENWLSAYNKNGVRLTTVDGNTVIDAGWNEFGVNYWKHPLKMDSTNIIEFDINITSDYAPFGVGSLYQDASNENFSKAIQYVGAWGKWGLWNGTNYNLKLGNNITQNTWHHIRIRNENRNMKLYCDNVLQWDYTLPYFSEEEYFNNYWFLFIQDINTWEHIYIKNITFKTGELVDDNTLNSIRSFYESQFNGGGVNSNLLTVTNNPQSLFTGGEA